MKIKKRVFRTYNYRECDAFAKYLHEMSLEGWHFTGWRGGMIFEKGEPADLDYVVEVFLDGTEMDLKPEKETEEYAEYCEAAGWKFIDSYRKFCVFQKLREDAEAIVTKEERFENINEAEWKEWKRVSVAWVMVLIINTVRFFTLDFPQALFSDVRLIFLVWMIYVFLWKVGDAVSLAIWGKNIKKTLGMGEAPFYKRDSQTRRYVSWGIGTCFMIYFACMYYRDGMGILLVFVAIIYMLLGLVTCLLEFFRPSRDQHSFIQLAIVIGTFMLLMTYCAVCVSDEFEETFIEKEAFTEGEINRQQVPLVLTDYEAFDGVIIDLNIQKTQSIFGKYLYCSMDYETEAVDNTESSNKNSSEYEAGLYETENSNDAVDYLRYKVYYCKYDWILERIWEEESKWIVNSRAVDCTDLWDAEYGVKDGKNEYYVRYPDGILCLYTGKDLNLEQISVVREKLDF